MATQFCPVVCIMVYYHDMYYSILKVKVHDVILCNSLRKFMTPARDGSVAV